jgi:hypothetical protein
MNGLPNSLQLAGGNGQQFRLEGTRMAPSTGTGLALFWNSRGSETAHDWTGKDVGIRKPSDCETALSASEIAVFLAKGALL